MCHGIIMCVRQQVMETCCIHTLNERTGMIKKDTENKQDIQKTKNYEI